MCWLFDGLFHEGYVQFSPCAQNTTIWKVWVVFDKVLTDPTTAPNTLLKIVKAWVMHSCLPLEFLALTVG